MELTTLKYFVTLARELHFRRAAKKLNITQAPLSSAIKKLEEQLQVRLFERTSRTVNLTQAGEIFLPEAEAVLKRADQALQTMADYRSGSRGQLAIGYNETAFNTFFPELLSTLHANHENLKLELRELETAEQMRALKEGSIDIAFMRPYGIDLSGLKSQLVSCEKYLLVMQKSHSLAKLEKITVEDLSGESIILFAREVNPAVYDRLSTLLTTPHLAPPSFRQDARNKSSMLALTAAGFGAALLPESSTKDLHSCLTSRTLDIPLPTVDIMAVWSPERESELLKKVISCLPELI